MLGVIHRWLLDYILVSDKFYFSQSWFSPTNHAIGGSIQSSEFFFFATTGIWKYQQESYRLWLGRKIAFHIFNMYNTLKKALLIINGGYSKATWSIKRVASSLNENNMFWKLHTTHFYVSDACNHLLGSLFGGLPWFSWLTLHPPLKIMMIIIIIIIINNN
jgi:hypothetical protein